MPRVSVIIPAWNCADYIGRTIDSVLAQDLPDTEIIVIDDGSKDATGTIARRYGAPVRYRYQNNQGAAAARNQGLNLARGEYIAFLDADDIWFPGKLRTQLQLLAQYPDHVGVFSNFHITDEHGKVTHENGIEQEYALFRQPGNSPRELFARDDSGVYTGIDFRHLFLGNFINTCSLLLRRPAQQQCGYFDTRLRTQEDYDFWLRLSKTGALLYWDQPLLCRCHRPGQLTSAAGQLAISRDVVTVVERHFAHACTVLGRQAARQRLQAKYQALALNLLGAHDTQGARRVLRLSLARTGVHAQTLALLAWSLIPATLADYLRHNLFSRRDSGFTV
ncbi:MAG TPA: glycosyltransferase family 2 protein [Gammaproteobacteria bacterium]|nr:glycosyltransferase family 2 protein [Gammaproteobacteria bacterium]